jgi:hypothetical protein
MSTAQTPQPPTPALPQVPRISFEQFDKIAGAYTRLLELREQTIHNPNRDAEIKGLVEYLAEEFVTHAQEFLGVWHVVRTEYEPLVNCLAQMHPRLVAISQQRQAAQIAQLAAKNTGTEEKPANVTTLIQP